jgi:hypothetical protein
MAFECNQVQEIETLWARVWHGQSTGMIPSPSINDTGGESLSEEEPSLLVQQPETVKFEAILRCCGPIRPFIERLVAILKYMLASDSAKVMSGGALRPHYHWRWCGCDFP